MSTQTLATGTPVVSVKDNRGLTVRVLNWNHEDRTSSLRLLVSHALLDDASRVIENRDPRLYVTWKADCTATANLHNTASLTGQMLRRESTDSGEQITLFDAAGRLVWDRDGRGTIQTVAYDELGRPENGSEQLSGSDEIRVSWRTEYGDAGPADDGSQGSNLRGFGVAQYNDGGLTMVGEVSLSGAVTESGWRFLASAEALPDWPESEEDRDGLLEADAYTTSLIANARGATLNQTDAMGHTQRWRYDVSGNIRHQTVTPVGGETQILLTSVTWSAAGQMLTELAGNGVTTAYSYDPQNQWLATITAQRADNTALQALSYGYDFTGNVTSISDGTVTTGYCRNQTTSGMRKFTYDALYQLLNASGRENAVNTAMSYSNLPAVLSPDSSQYVNYTRSYAYDDSGNLQTLKHTGAGSYTRIMTTETTSNRSVQQNDGGPQTPDDVAAWFDNNGNLQNLQVSSSSKDGLLWDGNNNLQSVILLSRSSGDNDREIYQYSGNQRVRKQTRTLVNSSSGLWDVDEVRYLPGLELRKSWQETANSNAMPPLIEELHVVTGQAGRASIRLLHWETGKPDDIANDQVRWSVDDNIGSLTLELDVDGQLISREEYYPFGGTAVWSARGEVEAEYKTVRYSGKERDSTGLYYYGYRYYAPWLCRWISADPAREVDGLNLFRMVSNNPVTLQDSNGLMDRPPPPPPPAPPKMPPPAPPVGGPPPPPAPPVGGPPPPPPPGGRVAPPMPPVLGMRSGTVGAATTAGNNFEPIVMAAPVLPANVASPEWRIEDYVDADAISSTISKLFNIEKRELNVKGVTQQDMFEKIKTIPGNEIMEFDQADLNVNPAAWTSPAGTVYMGTTSPDYSLNGELDVDKIRSTIIHETIHASSHEHVGFQNTTDTSIPNSNYDEYVTDYFAKMVFDELYPGRTYKTGYFTKDVGGRAMHWGGNLAKFMIDSGHVAFKELAHNYFNTGKLSALPEKMLTRWQAFAKQNRRPLSLTEK